MNDKLTPTELKVLAIIPYGAKEPIKTKEIQTRTGLEIRTIRKNNKSSHHGT